MLKNRIYRGETVHKGEAHPGEHEPIIDEGFWSRVEDRISENTVKRKLRCNAAETSLLAGIIRDGLGRKMSPSHTARKGKRYRYYVTHPAEVVDDTPAWRLPAREVEMQVVSKLVEFLLDQRTILMLVEAGDASKLAAVITRCQRTAEQLQTSTYYRRTKVPALVGQVDVSNAEMAIALSKSGLADFLGLPVVPEQLPVITAAVCRIRKGKEIKLVIGDNSASERDETLVSLLREANAIREEVLGSSDHTISAIAASTGRCRKRMTRLFRLSWIATEIVDKILAGRQPHALSTKSLLTIDLPLDWASQKAALNF